MKSYKREAAAALLLFWATLVIRVFFFVDDPSPYATLLITITGALVPLSMAAFHLHAYLNKNK